MKPLILVIDDYQDILDNLKMILEFNNFNVITSKNSKEAIKILSSIENLPNLIISDIMMPEMDGYELFKQITSQIKWNHIPFIFLSAKSSPEEIRFGKMLGIDDYLTKPFNEEDLLAIIKGKLKRNKESQLITKEVYKLLASENISPKLKKQQEEELNEIVLCWIMWDNSYGPKLEDYFSINDKLSYSIEKIAFQLYNAATTVYGQEGFSKSEGILLNIDNINRQSYIFFDSYPDANRRSGEQEYMLGVIAMRINYLAFLKIKSIFLDLSQKIKYRTDWNFQNYWEKISKILTSSIF